MHLLFRAHVPHAHRPVAAVRHQHVDRRVNAERVYLRQASEGKTKPLVRLEGAARQVLVVPRGEVRVVGRGLTVNDGLQIIATKMREASL